MSSKLFIGNLPYSATEETIHQMFSEVGSVVSVKIITDPMTRRSKGFGFVEMTSDEDATKAIAQLNGSELGGRMLKVDRPRPPSEGSRDRGGDRGDRGGRGGPRGFSRGR